MTASLKRECTTYRLTRASFDELYAATAHAHTCQRIDPALWRYEQENHELLCLKADLRSCDTHRHINRASRPPGEGPALHINRASRLTLERGQHFISIAPPGLPWRGASTSYQSCIPAYPGEGPALHINRASRLIPERNPHLISTHR